MKYILTSIMILTLLFINCEKKLNMPSTPSGPSSGIINYSYYFSSSATDIYDDSVTIRFDWGNGDTSFWSDYVVSGNSAVMSNSWSAAGTYQIRAQARTKSMRLSDWSFSKEFIISSNRPPNAPQNLIGPYAGSANIIYTFSTTAFDPDEDSIAYQFDWGNGEFSAWSDFIPAGVTLAMQYAWPDTGLFQIRARAQDINGAISGWSYAHNIQINLTGSPFPNYVLVQIPVGTEPASITVLPNGNYLYVANQTSADVSVIQASTNSVIATIPVGLNPACLAASVNGNYVYVANSGSNNIMVIRTSDNIIIDTIPVGDIPAGIAVLPNGQYLYVTNLGSDNVSVIQTSDHSVIATIDNISQPNGIACLPDNQYIYVTSPFQNNVTVIRVSDNTVIANIAPDNQPTQITASLSGEYVYVTNLGSNTISVIRASDNIVTASIPVLNNPFGITTYPYGNYLYVTNQFDNKVSVISGTANKVVATIPVQNNPTGLVAHPDGNYVYITNSSSNTVSVIKKY
ncbi:MAG: YncE family protein [Candidatus Latescibacteria bacterium]|nr:YncE family protein [Candidatus Latescibacterota bacterium]